MLTHPPVISLSCEFPPVRDQNLTHPRSRTFYLHDFGFEEYLPKNWSPIRDIEHNAVFLVIDIL